VFDIDNGQKFIGRNRPPRVQIEYEVETYGAQKKVDLPFVMGVLANLSGKPAEALPPVADRKYLDIDIDNFDQRMKQIKPRTTFAVPNTLTGKDNLMVELTFECMDDFGPAKIAEKIEPLNKLLAARKKLADLLTYMDGKSGAEELLDQILEDKDLLKALAAPAKEDAAVADSKPAPAAGDEPKA